MITYEKLINHLYNTTVERQFEAVTSEILEGLVTDSDDTDEDEDMEQEDEGN